MVFTAAVLEYLTAEVLELAGTACRDFKTKRIAPRHVMLAIRYDGELSVLSPGTIAGGGTTPYIHEELMGNWGEVRQVKADHRGIWD